MSVSSDGELAARAQSGDRDAFEALVGRTLPRVRAFLFRLAGPRADADDLAQETFLVAVRRLGELREPDRVLSWLFGIGVRVHRSRASAPRLPISDALDVAALAVGGRDGDAVERAEARGELFDALERLPLRCREAFLLRHVEELSPSQTADALGVPEGTARRWDFEARERLRRILSGRGLGATS